MDEATLSQVARIEASEGFEGAEKLRRFLRFAVEAKLKGEEGQIKEYVIGREVYGRDERYDPRTDPIVRVEARRLRAKLSRYYEGAGLADPVRIEFPKGSYVPLIRRADGEAKRRPRWAAMAGVAALLLTASGVAYRAYLPPRGLVAVVPAAWLWQERSGVAGLDEAAAEAIAAELANRRAAGVIAWPSIARYRGTQMEARELGAALGAGTLMIVSVRNAGAAARVTVFVTNPASGRKLWVADLFRPEAGTLDAQRELAKAVVDDYVARTPPR